MPVSFIFSNTPGCDTMDPTSLFPAGTGEKGGTAVFQRVYVEITNVCNLHCDFCPGTSRPAGAMSAADFCRVAEALRPCTEYLYLHVMGEPLLHRELPEILSCCHRLGFRVCLTTNGTLLGQRLPLLLDSPALHKVSVSLHSFEGNGGGAGLTEYVSNCLTSCRILSKNGVLCALRLWNQGGEDTLNGEITAILSRELGEDVAALEPDGKGNRRLAPRLFLEPGERFIWPGSTENHGPDAQFCYGLRQQIAVLWDGTVVPCCLDGEGRLALGNLFSQKLEDILAGPRAQAIRRGFDRRQPAEDVCRRCGFAARFNR